MSDLTTPDGTRLALSTWGPEGAPVIVLVHGLGLSTSSWGEVPDLLADRHRVVGYDLRGHGRSGRARDRDYSLAAHARDLDSVLDSVLPRGGRAVLVAHSLGGGILLEHIKDAEDPRIAGVVFAGSGGSGVTVPGLPARDLPNWAQTGLRYGWLQLLRLTARVGERLRPVARISDRLTRKAAFAPDAPEDAVRRVRDAFLTSRPYPLARTTLASVSHDGLRYADRLTAPTLVLHGTKDPEVPEDEAHELIDKLPHGELVELPGAGYMLPLLHGDLVAEQVARWVREVGLAEVR
jgi:pimeloyl-ACP methyl ester carboxylesterase